MENPTQPAPATTAHSTQKEKTPLFKKLAHFAKLGPPLPQRRRHRTTSAEAEQALAAKARMSVDDYRAWRESESRSSSRYSERSESENEHEHEHGERRSQDRDAADVSRNDSVREEAPSKQGRAADGGDGAGRREEGEEEGEQREARPGWDRRAGDHERERRRSRQEDRRQHRQEPLAGRKSGVGGERPGGDAGEIKLNEKGRYRSHGKEKKERGRLVKKLFRHGDDKAGTETVNGAS